MHHSTSRELRAARLGVDDRESIAVRDRSPRPRVIHGMAWLLAAWLVAATPAQQPEAGQQRLRDLLRELAATDPGTWATRIAELERQAQAHEQDSKRLREQAAALLQRATGLDDAGKKVRAEMERLQKLRALVRELAPAADAPAKPAPAATGPGMATAMPAAKTPAKVEVVTWRSHVEDLLGEHCAGCHDTDSKKGGLDVTSFAAVRQGGGSGSTIVPGQPDASRLFLLITHRERPFMPQDEDRLPDAKLEIVRSWIEHGACEDEPSARAFLAEKAKGTAPEPKSDAVVATAGPTPSDLPDVEVRRPERPGVLRSLARSPVADLLAMPGQQQVLLFDSALRPLGVVPSELASVEVVGFSQDGAALFAAGGLRGKRGRVEVFDVRSGRLLGAAGKERDVPLAAALAPDRATIAIGGSGKQVRVHGLGDAEIFTGKHDDFVLSLAFSPDGQRLAAADRSGTVQVWETGGGRLGQTLSGHRGAVHGVAFVGNTLLATAGADGTVRLFDVGTGKERWRQNAHAGEALAVAAAAAERIASCGSDGRIRVFDPTGRTLAQSPPLGEWLYAVAFGTGDVVFAGDWQGRLHRFDAKSKKVATTVPLGPAQ